MARISGIKTKLTRHNVDELLAKEIIGTGDLVDIITRMETLLDPETACQILDSSACGISKKEIKELKTIGAETLQERICGVASLGDFHSDWNIILNKDNTLTAGWIIKEKDSYACVCSAVVKNGVKVCDLSSGSRVMPLTYCICCAGHCRQHLQKLLDIQLRTKEIVSSPINSGGQNPCEFIFEII